MDEAHLIANAANVDADVDREWAEPAPPHPVLTRRQVKSAHVQRDQPGLRLERRFNLGGLRGNPGRGRACEQPEEGTLAAEAQGHQARDAEERAQDCVSPQTVKDRQAQELAPGVAHRERRRRVRWTVYFLRALV
jgi:hypothetical protein